MRSIALVTGASSGLGTELVRQLDAGAFGALDEIWVVARRADKLEALSQTCETTIRPFALDLTDPRSFDVLEDALVENPDTVVALLVNNAGFGTFGAFADSDNLSNARMVRLLMLAPVELTYRVLPCMRAGSRILNVASVAAFMPQPELAVYAAAKRFVLDFSRALDAELKEVDVRATALCPKFMRTGFLDHAVNDDVLRRMSAVTGFEPVERVAAKALRAARAGRALCIPSPDMKLFYAASKALPYPLALRLERTLMSILER